MQPICNLQGYPSHLLGSLSLLQAWEAPKNHTFKQSANPCYMPDNKSALSRYRTIDRCLRNNMHPYPSKEEIRDKCEHDIFGEIAGKISISQIEKDFDAMRNDPGLGYFAPIKYHKVRKGYYYDEADYSIEKLPLSPQEEDALKFASLTLYQYRNIAIFEHFKEAIDKIYTRLSLSRKPEDPQVDEFVHFERTLGSDGNEWLQPIYHAIANNHPISFEYNNIYKQEQKHFDLIPYLLKENRNKWYVLGWYEKHQTYLIFALDRMSNVQIQHTLVTKRKDFNPEAIFKHSTGIMGGNSELMQVEIEVSEPLSVLLEKHPMHPSQQTIKKLKDGIRVSMEVINSPELMNQLLSFGKHLTIIKPATLKKKLRAELEEMLQKNQ